MLRVFLKRRENFLYEVYVHLKKKSTGEGIKKKKKKKKKSTVRKWHYLVATQYQVRKVS